MESIQCLYKNYLQYPLSLLGISDPPMTFKGAEDYLKKEAEKKNGPEPVIGGRRTSQLRNTTASVWEGFHSTLNGQLGVADPSLKSVIEGLQPGTVIDLGCGFQQNTVELLERGWSVIALDSCPKVLSDLKEVLNGYNPSWIEEGKITFVCEKMETYQFPSDVELIFAQSLPYCPPQEVIPLWEKMHNSLKEGGYIVGHMFPRYSNSAANLVTEWVMNGWMGPRTLAECLLEAKNYKILKCEYDKYWFESDPKRIHFVGIKTPLIHQKKE